MTYIRQQYYCPNCKQPLTLHDTALSCLPCQQTFSIKGGIPVFTAKEEYWCNVSKQKMHDLIDDAEQSNNWREAINKHIPRYAAAVTPLYRADAQFLFPIDKNSRVLDAGCMWGGLTIPIAQYCKEVVALDKTWETLKFLTVRAHQLGHDNITPIVSPIDKLPFPDEYFDLVILNGVLEWLGLAQDIILEEHWKNKRQDTHQYKQTPNELQLFALKEIYRVIKKGGGIYIAIENRIGLQYFCGHPDDHVNVRFVTFMPRWFANFVTKLRKNVEYRTYIYSPKQLKKLVTQAGFNNIKIYSAYPHYGKISRLTPFTVFDRVSTLATVGYANIRVFALTHAWRLVPTFWRKNMSPSIAIVAHKEKPTYIPRLLNCLQEKGLISSAETSNYELILFNNRFGDGHSTNYLVYDKTKNRCVYLCKIERYQQGTNIINEAENALAARQQLQNSDIHDSIPDVYFYGKVDDITLQVSQYVDAQNVGKGITDGLRCISRFSKKKPNMLFNSITHWGRDRWLKINSPHIIEAIKWLAAFQKNTQSSSYNNEQLTNIWLPSITQQLEKKGLLNTEIEKAISQLKASLLSIAPVVLPICMQHGDFDICNLLVAKEKYYIVDFEHAEQASLPFFDLGNLIFSPLITEWYYQKSQLSLTDYVEQTAWKKYLTTWVEHYQQASGLSHEVLQLLPAFAALEQHAKLFPDYRNPADYPMYGTDKLLTLIRWKL